MTTHEHDRDAARDAAIRADLAAALGQTPAYREPGPEEPRTLAFELTLRAGATADDGMTLMSHLVAMLGPTLAATLTVTDVARQRAEIERLRTALDAARGTLDLRDSELIAANAQRDNARAEVERLRVMLDALTRRIAGHYCIDHGGTDCLLSLAEGARRDAGLPEVTSR